MAPTAMVRLMYRGRLKCLCAAFALLGMAATQAHHALGRPTYSLSDGAAGAPRMQVETRIGDYFVSYAVIPAFPKPDESARIHLHATRMDNDRPLTGAVTFSAREDGWFDTEAQALGVQKPFGGGYRQTFSLAEAGDYLVTASFSANGEPYAIDFPLRVGRPTRVAPVALTLGAIALLLVVVKLIQHRRLRAAREQARP